MTGAEVFAALGLFAVTQAMGRMADVDILARTLWGEARGEGVGGMVAVAHVVINRVADPRWPNSVRGVVLQPMQFSAWNAGDPNREKMLRADIDTPGFREAWAVAAAALSGKLDDPTGGADHYFNPAVSPDWARYMQKVASIGKHDFYRDEG